MIASVDRKLSALEELVSRSRLLGADPAIVNYGGGNTSCKTVFRDHRGNDIPVLWVKGSGSDLATIRHEQFSPIRLGDAQELESRAEMTDDEMVDYLGRCVLDPMAPRPSIETVLHAFLPFTHIDHTHPSSVIAMCCCANGEALARECFGDRMVWVPYVRPGFALAKLALNALEGNPDAEGMLLSKHGLVTWGATSQESYDRTVSAIEDARAYLERRATGSPAFGGRSSTVAWKQEGRNTAIQLLPTLRGKLIGARRAFGSPSPHVVLHFDDSDSVMQFVNSARLRELSAIGAACPDHVLYTRFAPAICAVTEEAFKSPEELDKQIAACLEAYATTYTEFFEANSDGSAELFVPTPNVILIPGVGMVTTGQDAWIAGNTAALYKTAIEVMRWASGADEFASLTPKEAWEIEYWPLELYKLSARPEPKPLAGRVALITGGAGAIGRATARRLLASDAHVVIADVETERGQELHREFNDDFPRRALFVQSDAGSEEGTSVMMDAAILSFGGCDIVIPNAGIALSGPIDETSLEEWTAVHSLLVTGYFLTCRIAFAVMKQQGAGGVIIINSSKNGLAAGRDAIAYTTAKAAELHMTRCLAEEGGPYSIRVNAVAPDAVIAGSGLWSDSWKSDRARAYGFDVAEISEYYRQRNSLKVEVRAEDVAEAIHFLACDSSSRTTGCVITVDGGLAAAYPR